MAKPGQIVIHLGQARDRRGARMVFFENPASHAHQQSLVSEENVAHEESVLTLTRGLREVDNSAKKDSRRWRAVGAPGPGQPDPIRVKFHRGA